MSSPKQYPGDGRLGTWQRVAALRLLGSDCSIDRFLEGEFGREAADMPIREPGGGFGALAEAEERAKPSE
jgi:hypothetical protein